MIRYDITHTTVYRYRTAVSFGEHRVMFRPRDSHDLRVLATDLNVSPMAHVRLIQDPHSNSVALVQPLVSATELRIVCTFTIEHAHTSNLELPLSPGAELFPFAYSLEERFDLEQYLRPHHDDPQGQLTAWTRQFIRTDGPTHTRDLLVQMNQHIRDTFRYAARDEEGTQTPLRTLALGSGTCRDFALLMMEAARRIGIATRFVSGYLYDPALDNDGASDGTVGAGR
jgi:transglutaminase-like putative cysteine protease